MADVTAATAETVTLVAATHTSIELTGAGRVLELAHHDSAGGVVYFDVFAVDPDNELTGAGAADERVLLPGERRRIGAARAAGDSAFVELISAGTPTVTVELIAGDLQR